MTHQSATYSHPDHDPCGPVRQKGRQEKDRRGAQACDPDRREIRPSPLRAGPGCCSPTSDDAVALLSPMVSADPSFVQPRILLGLAYLGKYNTGEAIKQFDDAPVASQVVELKEGLGEPRPGCAASPGREAGRGGRFSQGGRPHRAAESPGQPAAR